jgi:hypothetical protein
MIRRHPESPPAIRNRLPLPTPKMAGKGLESLLPAPLIDARESTHRRRGVSPLRALFAGPLIPLTRPVNRKALAVILGSPVAWELSFRCFLLRQLAPRLCRRLYRWRREETYLPYANISKSRCVPYAR